LGHILSRNTPCAGPVCPTIASMRIRFVRNSTFRHAARATL
jgi:hypothetical protein